MKVLRNALRILPLLALLTLAASSAAACPVCFEANQRSRKAYYATTGALLLLPPALVGGFTFWYQRRARRLPGEDGDPLG